MEKKGEIVTLGGEFIGGAATVSGADAAIRNFYVIDFTYGGKDRGFEDGLEELRGSVLAARVSERDDDCLAEAFAAYPPAYGSLRDARKYLGKGGHASVMLTGTIRDLIDGYREIEIKEMKVEQ